MLSRLHHVGIAVQDADVALTFYRDALGLPVSVDRVLEREGVRGVLLPIGDSEIELLQPVNSGSSVAKFIEARGPGLHHICFETDDCAEELRIVSERGALLIDQEPRPGLAGMIGFLHPKSNHGVLVELATPLDQRHLAAGGEGVARGIREVGIVVRNRQAAQATYSRHFELERVEEGSDSLESVGASASFLKIGGSRLAFLEAGEPDSMARKFAQERAEGLFLITLEVADLPGAINRLRSFGAECSDPTASDPTDSGEAFVLPSATSGVNLRIVGAPLANTHRHVENHG